jgi:hypothetical protein
MRLVAHFNDLSLIRGETCRNAKCTHSVIPSASEESRVFQPDTKTRFLGFASK